VKLEGRNGAVCATFCITLPRHNRFLNNYFSALFSVCAMIFLMFMLALKSRHTQSVTFVKKSAIKNNGIAVKKAVIVSGAFPLTEIVAWFVAELDKRHEARVAENETDLHKLIGESAPDLVLIDSGCGGASYRAVSDIHRRYPAITLAVFSFEALSTEDGARFLLCGASGCCRFSFDINARDIGIETLLKCGEYVTGDVSRAYANMTADFKSFDMTMREREIYGYLIQGKKPKDIAKVLGCAEATVKTHQRSVYKKMRVTSGGELIKAAFDRGGLWSFDNFTKPDCGVYGKKA
jgi:DNA-binding NarL/FixJ family response regulator